MLLDAMVLELTAAAGTACDPVLIMGFSVSIGRDEDRRLPKIGGSGTADAAGATTPT